MKKLKFLVLLFSAAIPISSAPTPLGGADNLGRTFNLHAVTRPRFTDEPVHMN